MVKCRNAGDTIRTGSNSLEQVWRMCALLPGVLGNAASASLIVARKWGTLNFVCLTPEPNASSTYLSGRLGYRP